MAANPNQLRFFDRLHSPQTTLFAACRTVGAVGFSSLLVLLSRFGCGPRSTLSSVPSTTLRKLEALLRSLRSGRTVRRLQLTAISEKRRSGSFEGLRHSQSLPVRGQRTHSNAKTAARISTTSSL